MRARNSFSVTYFLGKAMNLIILIISCNNLITNINQIILLKAPRKLVEQ